MPGGSALIVFEIVRAARRSVASGLVHPHLEAADGRWHALWGATLDERVRDELAALAHAAPAAAADAFDGDTDALVHDLYGCAVDELARRALRTVPLVPRPPVGAPRAPSSTSSRGWPRRARRSPRTPATPRSSDGSRRGSTRASPAARARRGTSASASTSRSGRRDGAVVLELWLEAADDPTLALPASLLRDGSDEVFAFLRESDPRRALELRLQLIAPVLESAGIELRGDPPSAVELDHAQVGAFMREGLPRLEQLGVPVRLPARMGGDGEPHQRQPRRDDPGRRRRAAS